MYIPVERPGGDRCPADGLRTAPPRERRRCRICSSWVKKPQCAVAPRDACENPCVTHFGILKYMNFRRSMQDDAYLGKWGCCVILENKRFFSNKIGEEPHK